MGSGSRFTFGVTDSVGFSFVVSRFPFAVTVNILVLCFYVSIGFGKGYDE